MSVTRKSSDLPALGVDPNSIPAMTDNTVSRTRVWDDMANGRLPYKVVGKKRRIVTTADAINYINQLPNGPTVRQPNPRRKPEPETTASASEEATA
jgi:hypothetical protein